jgi:hydrogenase maturation protease
VRSTLVLGVGNILLSDEGVGIHVARRLQVLPLPPEIEVIDGGTEGFELIRFFEGREQVIIVDCLLSREPPGTIIRAAPDQLDLRWAPGFSPHQSGLRELLFSARALPSPPAITIIGIVPAETGRVSMDLSAAVAGRMDRILASVLETVRGPALPPPS